MMTYFAENESLLATTFLFKGTLAQMTTLHNKFAVLTNHHYRQCGTCRKLTSPQQVSSLSHFPSLHLKLFSALGPSLERGNFIDLKSLYKI